MWLADDRFSREPRGLPSLEESRPESGRAVTGPRASVHSQEEAGLVIVIHLVI